MTSNKNAVFIYNDKKNIAEIVDGALRNVIPLKSPIPWKQEGDELKLDTDIKICHEFVTTRSGVFRWFEIPYELFKQNHDNYRIMAYPIVKSMKMKIRTERAQWFHDMIGKKVYRQSNGCDCISCNQVLQSGVVIKDEMHADYLYDIERDYNAEGHRLHYQSKPDGRNN